MTPAGIAASVTFDLAGSPTWTLLDGATVTREADALTIARPGRELVRGRMLPGETHRAAYDRLLELDRLQASPPVVHDDYSAAVTVEADIDGQSVTVRVRCQLAHAEPRVLYATRAEVRGAGEGPLLVGDVVAVSEDMVSSVEAALVDAWTDLEAA